MRKLAQKHDTERTAIAFREAEASLALKGLDPSGPAYNRAKALRIAGKISADEAAEMILAEARQKLASDIP